MPSFLDWKVRLKPNQAVVATFRMRNLKVLSKNRHECLVPNPKSKLNLLSEVLTARTFAVLIHIRYEADLAAHIMDVQGR